ncbi:hypothetical protein [Nitrosovibrio sp. Nv17]|uniref:hypothetical protein n=1 Tax=Nitrosovibrio sp. Nv17 TaxID=1855339 RepID=UPI000930EAFA|nr:hypothetical protein [Nitrosovibrio sp. Nv17]
MSDSGTGSQAGETDICVQHARVLLVAQLEKIKDKGYDFAPPFRQMTVQLYLVGVMWRHGENLDLPNAREHAFQALQSMLVEEGMSRKRARRRIEFLSDKSRVEDGSDAYAVTAGYEAGPDDDSLAVVFDEYRDEVRVSGALWRTYERGKKIMFLGGMVAAFITIWFVTIFLPKTEGVDILAAGLLAAILVMLPAFLIGLLIYRAKIRKADAASPPRA